MRLEGYASTLSVPQDVLLQAWKEDPISAPKKSLEAVEHVWQIECDDEHTELTPLSKRIRPATVKDERLVRINLEANHGLKRCFNYNSKTGEEIAKPTLVGQCITFHRFPNGEMDFHVSFRPTVGEVMRQLPKELKSSNEELFFTTTEIKDAQFYLARDRSSYSVALTRFYRNEKD